MFTEERRSARQMTLRRDVTCGHLSRLEPRTPAEPVRVLSFHPISQQPGALLLADDGREQVCVGWGGGSERHHLASLPRQARRAQRARRADERLCRGHHHLSVTTTICLREGFEDRQLGLWCVLRLRSHRLPPAFTPRGPPSRRTPAFLPGHYEHGFDSEGSRCHEPPNCLGAGRVDV